MCTRVEGLPRAPQAAAIRPIPNLPIIPNYLYLQFFLIIFLTINPNPPCQLFLWKETGAPGENFRLSVDKLFPPRAPKPYNLRRAAHSMFGRETRLSKLLELWAAPGIRLSKLSKLLELWASPDVDITYAGGRNSDRDNRGGSLRLRVRVLHVQTTIAIIKNSTTPPIRAAYRVMSMFGIPLRLCVVAKFIPLLLLLRVVGIVVVVGLVVDGSAKKKYGETYLSINYNA